MQNNNVVIDSYKCKNHFIESKKDVGMVHRYFVFRVCNNSAIMTGRGHTFDSHVSQSKNGITFKAPCSRQRLCELVRVMIEKLDDRSDERIMCTQILKRFVIKSLLTDFPVIL